MTYLSFKDILKNAEAPTYYELLGIAPDAINAHEIQKSREAVEAAVSARIPQARSASSNPVVQAALEAMIKRAGEALANPVQRAAYENLLKFESAGLPLDANPEFAREHTNYVEQHAGTRGKILKRELRDDELPSFMLKTIRSNLDNEDARAKSIAKILKQRHQQSFALRALTMGIVPGKIGESVYNILLTRERTEQDEIEMSNLACHVGLKNFAMPTSERLPATRVFPVDEVVGVMLAGVGTFTESATGELTFKRWPQFENAAISDKLGKFLQENDLLPDAPGTEPGTVVFNGAKALRIKSLIETANNLFPLQTTSPSSWAMKHGKTSPIQLG